MNAAELRQMKRKNFLQNQFLSISNIAELDEVIEVKSSEGRVGKSSKGIVRFGK